MQRNSLLGDRAILVVEDDYLIATDLRLQMEDEGATIIGPAGTVDDALQLLDDRSMRIDAATVDINIRGKESYLLADALTARAIPFVFVSGYSRSDIPSRFEGAAFCEKPTRPANVIQLLHEQLMFQ